MIVIGTAGHIDHGKSSIVKRLTGTDPDRLPEEQARGMTIDLGFAFYQTPHHQHIAFVDVPGHERFVKNMIAGAGGIDVVMLVIAADDGWMPQSQEHFQIVKLLGVRHGIIALNKIDLVEPDWLELLEQEIRTRVGGSFLAEAPIFRLSAQQGMGFAELRTYLNQLPELMARRKDIGKARLYLDRSFIRQGIGAVATGTLRGGSLKVGQPVSVWPSQKVSRIRTLQTHSEDVQSVGPAERTAISLTGIEKDELIRGGAISDRLDLSYFSHNPVLAAEVSLLAESPIPLEDRRKVLLLVGTAEVEAEARIFETDTIQPGQSGVCFFRPDEPVYGLVGDRFIVRLPTPMVTLGGCKLLDHLPQFPRRKDLNRYEYLRERLGLDSPSLILSELRKQLVAPCDRLLEHADLSSAEITEVLGYLVTNSHAFRFGEYAAHSAYFKEFSEEFLAAMGIWLKEHPHLKGLPLDTLQKFSHHEPDAVAVAIDILIARGQLVKVGDLYNLAGRDMSLKGVIKQAHDQIMAALTKEPYAPPSLSSFASQGKNHQTAIKFILDSGEGVKCGADFIFLQSVWDEIIAFMRERLAESGRLTVADLKERFNFSRKYVIPILEETDRLGLTAREGDLRIKGARFGQ